MSAIMILAEKIAPLFTNVNMKVTHKKNSHTNATNSTGLLKVFA